MFDNKTIFVTGGTGSWGHELVAQILSRFQPREIRIYSRGEHKQVAMRQEFNDPRLRFIIGDVRDRNILSLSMAGSDYVFHLAALKHVPVCEDNTWEAVLTNIYGTQNVIECAIAAGVTKVIDISTDKAVEPYNHYGVTKACGEKLIVNANNNYVTDTQFVCIRGGNVLGTNGSVLPLFKRQLQENNRISVTDENMTRYLMSTRQAISLVFEATSRSQGGEIFVMRMPATTVRAMADAMTNAFGNVESKRDVMGPRQGEKQHEVLVSRHEAPRTRVLSQDYYIILPHAPRVGTETAHVDLPRMVEVEFNSQNARQLDEEEFRAMLNDESWLWE